MVRCRCRVLGTTFSHCEGVISLDALPVQATKPARAVKAGTHLFLDGPRPGGPTSPGCICKLSTL